MSYMSCMSTYVTVRQNRKPKEISWEDVLFETVTVNDLATQKSVFTGTVTRKYDTIDEKLLQAINVDEMINILEQFNELNKNLFEQKREDLYRHFSIPKKTGGFRPIDQPVDELQNALKVLANILTERFGVLYHTSAFAYVKGRSIVDCVEKHKKNESMWFLKTDFSGFFPSTTIDFTMKMLKMVFPLSEICKTERGYNALRKAISLGFLNDSLPQGTCLSPILTNAIMIPIDHTIFNELAHRHIVYTRYADDMHISAKDHFPWEKIVEIIRKTLKEFDAPYVLKDEKTHYGSRKGRNWMLGLMLNGQNEITVGYRNKKYFKAAMTSFILDTKNGKRWDIDDVMHLRGELSYYMMVEKQYFNEIIERMNNKWNVNVLEMFKQQLYA